jgi:hypothetical protein
MPVLLPPALSRPDFTPRGVTNLSTVFIDPELLPTERLSECARSVLREKMPSQYDAQGYRPLREAIAKRLVARGLDSGASCDLPPAQQSLDIVARSLTTSGSARVRIAYRLLFESLGPSSGLPIDRSGRLGIDLVLGPLEAGAAYLISFPTGYSYTAGLRACSISAPSTASRSSRTIGAATCSPTASTARCCACSAARTCST